jgi:hypothetical protein
LITAGTTTNGRFIIELTSLTALVAGPAAHFDKTQNYQWLIASASGGISGFDPAVFAIDTSAFANDFTGGWFGVSRSGGNVYLDFTVVPEPSSLVLLGIGAAILFGCSSRRQKRANVDRCNR